jgi:sarcosine oxidase
MTDRLDVIVVGLGAMGSATCYHLASRGVRVLGLDRFDVPNTRGSSHGLSRLIRQAYYEHADYVPLLRRAWDLWRQLEAETDQVLLHATGGVYIGPRGSPFVDRSRAAAAQYDLPHEHLDRAALAARYPQFHVPDDYEALWERNAGLLVPERCVAAHADRAARLGADVRGQEGVIDWEAHDAGVTVRTHRGSYHADSAVFCGGPWTDLLVRRLGVQLVVTRQVLGWVQPLRPAAFELGTFPVWAIDHLDDTIHYGFPLLPDGAGLKVAHHAPGQHVSPDTVNRDPQPGDEETFRPALRRFLPDADGPLASLRVCLYTNSPDGHFILDRHPKHDRVWVACGFSGHGFKFASVVGEAMADLATAGKTDLPIGFLGLRRFAHTW